MKLQEKNKIEHFDLILKKINKIFLIVDIVKAIYSGINNVCLNLSEI